MAHHASPGSLNGHSPSTPRVDDQYTCFSLVLDRSPIHRWGVYAGEAIPARRKVIEYTGEMVSRREAKRRSDRRARVYLFRIDDYWCKDGAVGGSGAEYINHSCDPNLFFRVTYRHILYIAKRDIVPGEELTVDYQFAADAQKVRCVCGAPTCRGTINVR